MFRGLFKMYLLNKFLGGRRVGRRRGMGCGCLGLVLVIVLIFLLMRGCAAGVTGGYGY